MKRILPVIFLLSSGLAVFAQVSRDVELRIVKAEDARRFDAEVEGLMSDRSEAVRVRAALAAGRIGDERAVEPLARLLGEGSPKVREMAAFALGEVESIKGADAILAVLRSAAAPDPVRARAVEAAGKIAAANAGPANATAEQRNPKAVELGEAILDVLEAEEARRERQYRETVRLALAAALRARPEGSDTIAALFLTNLDARVRADAANTMARLRAKNANAALRGMLMNDADPTARANAARALGAAEDKEAVNMLIVAAADDDDQRVRVSAIRALATLRDPFAVDRLLEHGEKLLARAKATGGRARRRAAATDPAEKSELLEIATALGRLVPKTNDARTVRFLTALGDADRYRSPETETAFARVAPRKYTEYLVAKKGEFKTTRTAVDAALQGIREFTSLGATEDEITLRKDAVEQLRRGLERYAAGETPPTEFSIPELLRSYAAFKPEGLDAELRRHMSAKSVFIRAAAAELLADRPANDENFAALKTAFPQALLTDKMENDAQLGILAAMYKLDKKASVPTLLIALNAPDFVVRKSAFEMLSDAGLQREFRQISSSLENARKERRNLVLSHSAASGTRLGQLLNTDADYRRALGRRNGSVRAVLATTKGSFTIDLLPEEAPLTVDNFVKLARARFFNGLEVHRVVPNFVMQDGDPRGDGNGGPGWSIRCEINMVPFDRGAVGMALSGKDTGGSQWFVTHSQQPHLDGGYTVFGKVNETGMKVVDNIVRGDKIISVRIIEGSSRQRTQRARSK